MRTQAEVAAPAKTEERRGGVRSLLAGVWGAFFGLPALWMVWGSPVDIGSQPTASKPAVAVAGEPQSPNRPVQEASQPQFAAKAIRDIFPIADRVIARNPEEEPSPFDAADFELTSLSDEELAELDAELVETLEDEPLPALIDGIPDDSELLVVDAESTLDTSTASNEVDDTSFARAEELYRRLADAALVNEANSSDSHAESTDYGPFVREHWRVVRFRLTRPDGDQVRIWLARPARWVEAEQVRAGGKYEFDMEEVGAVGFADVLSIDECLVPLTRQNADHHLVTGKFEHDATNVISLYVAGEDEPIGTTANHPFWSDDRQAFVEAATLRPGEHLINAKGERVRVVTHSPRPGPHTVFNLEVDGSHTYSVGEHGELVHNACTDRLIKSMKAAGTWIAGATHHIVAAVDRRAAPARRILNALGKGLIETAGNGVSLAQSIHKGIHTNKNYETVNRVVRTAFRQAMKDARSNGLTGANRRKFVANAVWKALDGIRRGLLAGNSSLWK